MTSTERFFAFRRYPIVRESLYRVFIECEKYDYKLNEKLNMCDEFEKP